LDKFKFNGILQQIIEQNPNIDISEYLEQKLNIPQFKAEILAARIEKEYYYKHNTKIEQDSIKTILEKPNKHEISQKTTTYPLDSLSDREFERFIKWLFEQTGYDVQPEKHSTEMGFDILATKNGEKIVIQARRYPIHYKVSNLILLLADKAKRAYDCKQLIIAATAYFTKQAITDAQKYGIELWDLDMLNAKITEVRKNADSEVQSVFPQYKESLMQTLLGLEETKDFLFEHKADGKYDVYLLGIRFPLLTFQVCLGEVIRCIFRIKNNEPVGESEGTVLIKNDRDNIRIGPDDERAYALIIRYLEQFLE
jgi:restriction system protein